MNKALEWSPVRDYRRLVSSMNKALEWYPARGYRRLVSRLDLSVITFLHAVRPACLTKHIDMDVYNTYLFFSWQFYSSAVFQLFFSSFSMFVCIWRVLFCFLSDENGVVLTSEYSLLEMNSWDSKVGNNDKLYMPSILVPMYKYESKCPLISSLNF